MRVECPHAAECAGCPAIHLPYDAQLAEKAARVERALARHPELAAVDRRPVVGADALEGYRARAKLVVDRGAVGLYGRDGDHVVVDVPGCRVLSPSLRAAVDAVRDAAGRAPLRDALLALDVRAVRPTDARRPAVLVTLVLEEGHAVDVASLENPLRAALDRRGVALAVLAASTRARRSPQVLGGPPRVVAGPDAVEEPLEVPGGGEVCVPVVPGGFVQAHPAQAARLRARLVEALEAGGVALAGARVVDAYAGAGALGLGLAALGARVALVERFAPAVERARDAAARQGLAVEALAADAGAGLETLRRRGEPVDVVVLNPPRRGVAPSAREAAAALAPRRLVVVSCEPDTFARDLAHLARLGWAAPRIEPFDLIPLSREVECLAVLEPAPPPPPDVLGRHGALLAVVAAPHEAPPALLARARALGEPPATAVVTFPEGGSGVAVLAAGALASPPSVSGTWIALVRGVTRPKGTVAGRGVRTRHRRLEVVGGHSLLEVHVEPDVPGAVAAHLARLGHPVLGDRRRGHAPSNRFFEERLALDRAFLHRAHLALGAPDGPRFEARAPLPGDLETVLARLRGERAP